MAYKKWCGSEVNALYDLKEHYTYQQISEKLGRSVSSVKQKMNAIGLFCENRSFTPPQTRENWQFWSTKEIKYLKTYAGKKPLKDIAGFLKRDLTSCKNKCARLNLSHRVTIWDEAKVKEIIRLRDEEEYSWKKISTFVGINANSCSRKYYLVKYHYDIRKRNDGKK